MISDVTFAKVVFVLGNVWLFLGFLALFTTRGGEKLRIAFLVSFLGLTALVIGLRNWDVGVDTPKYVAAFKSEKINTYHSLELYEPGYIYLGIIFKKLLKKYNFYLALVSFAIGIFVFLAYRNLLPERLYPLAFALYLSTFVFWLSNISMIRQGVAISLLFYVFSLLEIGHRHLATLWYFIACSWHFSAFFFPIFYILYRVYLFLYRRKKIFFLLIYLIIIINMILPGSLLHKISVLIIKYLYLVFSNSFLEKMHSYLFWTELKPWNIKHVYFLILSLALLAYFYIKKNQDVLRAYMFVFVGLTVLVLVKFDEMVADRMFMYFVPAIPLLILRLIPILFPIDRDQNLAYIVIFLGAIVWFNIKFYLLQYTWWFINPVQAIK